MGHEGMSLQERWAPANRCFGCGPANERGLRIRSFPEGDEVVCSWKAEPHHEAFDGFLNGGIVGALFDCHCNWAAVHHMIRQGGLDQAPCTVTAELHVFLKRPTPTREPVLLRARVAEATGTRAVVEGEMHAGGKVTATCRAVYVAVSEGHPAFHRW